jgi:hypothetical protein
MTDTVDEAITAAGEAVSTEAPVVAATVVAEKKELQNEAHGHLYDLLTWLKAKFEAVGLDIKTEIEKL